jgi:hydrogenase maturation factor
LSVPRHQADELLTSLAADGVKDAVLIGRITADPVGITVA